MSIDSEALGRIESKVDALSDRMSKVEEVVATGKGAVRVLAWLGAVITGIIAAIYAVVSIANQLTHWKH